MPVLLIAGSIFEPMVLLRTLVVMMCLLACNKPVAAQAESERATIDVSVFALPDEEEDAESSQPLPILKPLTPADLPPPNPLVRNFSRTGIVFNRDWRAGRNEYRGLIEQESRAFGLAPALVDAIMAVESRYNPASVGFDGEVGLMQVMLPTARMLGFNGSVAELAAPEVNVHYGTKYLAGAWRRAGGDLCTAAMKYRAGHGETRFSFLSVEYCLRVRSHLAANGVAVSGPVPQATFGRSVNASFGGRSVAGRGSVDFAGMNTRLRAMMTDRKTPNASN